MLTCATLPRLVARKRSSSSGVLEPGSRRGDDAGIFEAKNACHSKDSASRSTTCCGNSTSGAPARGQARAHGRWPGGARRPPRVHQPEGFTVAAQAQGLGERSPGTRKNWEATGGPL
eukprot:g27745.t1